MSSPAGDGIDVSWHADQALLSGYVRGEIDESASMALEAHVIGCAVCRTALGRLADPGRLEQGKEALLAAVNAPRRGPLEALLIRVGVAEETARLVAATPSLGASWFAAVAMALGFAVVAAHQSRNGLLVFLVIAPLLPVVGVAAAYGPGVDPTYEIGLAAPLSSFRLLLLRAAAVLTATTVLAGLAGLALPAFGWTAATWLLPVLGWLLPALGLTLASVALSTAISPVHAARLVTLAWLVVVAAVTVPAPSQFALFNHWSQIAFALLAAVAGLVIVHRREAFDQGRPG